MSGFRWGGGKKRRDLAEKPIMVAVRGIGAQCWQVSGRGLPDLIVKFRGRYFCGEVKSDGGRETANQGEHPIWRTPDQVLRDIGAVK